MSDRKYTMEELMAMPASEVKKLMSKATFNGTAVVRRADGSIKYDDPAQAGAYNEENSHVK